MTIWESPVTQLYGFDPDYPINRKLNPATNRVEGFHTGVDYGCPVGTSVTVNGLVIALSGNTGASTGPHCHVGHWNYGTNIPNKPQEGRIVSGARVSEVGYDATNGHFVRVQDVDGTNWVYLHLSEVKVKVGDKLQGVNMEELERLKKELDIERSINHKREDFLNRIALAAGDDLDPVEDDDVERIIANIDAKNKRIEALEKEATVLKPGKYIVKE